ncbi:MAG TPA: hypothetical protein VJ742_12905 [Nitrososphaera sp.]|nr:hypothetical protein [Nitrososphaera sp.]
MRRRWLIALIPVTLLGGALGGACTDKSTEQFRDAGRGETNDQPADIITMPDGFSNLASKCDGPNRVYVAFKADQNRAALAVVKDDPRCSG